MVPTVSREGAIVTLTLGFAHRRNALSQVHLDALLAAVTQIAESDAAGLVIAATGPVFCSGHDLAEVAGADEAAVSRLLASCTALMRLLATCPQVTLARVHGLATAAGCQLVAACDLAVATRSAAFALPGGAGGWFCHTPAVEIAHSVGRKRANELALTGDPIDADTALIWGLVNRVVDDSPGDAALDAEVAQLMARATRGSRASKAAGKAALDAQRWVPVGRAYDLTVPVMAASSQTAAAQEGARAFVDKRHPVFSD